jgi:DNA polymerase-3 subunit epsilon
MTSLEQETFVCLDCETTGLEPGTDRILEIAAVKFQFSETLASFETLIDPECSIPDVSIAIHHITESMVIGKPKIQEVLPQITEFAGDHIIIGHGINLDLAFLSAAAQRFDLPNAFEKRTIIDTFRLARLYGESPTNSLETLRQHFNIAAEGAHRAMNDVTVNIGIFKYLAKSFKTTGQILERLSKPIQIRVMPLGKYKGRPFADIPIEYLEWIVRGNFDDDLLFSVRTELQKRRRGDRFSQNSSPFANL